MSGNLSFNAKLELRAATRNQRKRASEMMMSSVIPSARYCRLPPSPVRLNGSTTIEGRDWIGLGAAAAVSFALSTLTTLFFVVDPFAAVPLFLTMTVADPPGQKRRIASRAALASAILLSAFAALGSVIFKVLGITLGAFRVAGGILLFLLAVDMLRAQRSRQRTSPEEEDEGLHRDDPSIFPLAIPMLAGPGATSAVMVLVSRAHHVWQYAIVFAGIVLTALSSYWILRGALSVEKRMGQTGMNVLQRVMGLILAATAVQFAVEGITTMLPTMSGRH